MEKNESDYHSLLWNQYENLQNMIQQKYVYFEGKLKLFKDISAEYSNIFVNMKKHFDVDIKQKRPKEILQYQEIFDILTYYINNALNNQKNIFDHIVSYIDVILNKYEKVKRNYNEFKEYLPKYTSEKEKFIKTKEKYHKSALQSETSLLNFYKENLNKNTTLNIPKKYFKETLENLKKYQIGIENVNNKRKIAIDQQEKLINYYSSTNQMEIKIYYQIVNDFFKIEHKNNLESYYVEQVNNLKTNYDKHNIKEESWQKLSELKSNEKPDPEFIFEQYQSNIDFDKCKEKEEFQANVETVKMIKSQLDNAFNDFTVEREENKKNMRELLEKLFNSKEEITDTDKQTFINYLDDTATHHLFLVVLSKLRTNNEFNKSKKLIELLSESINKILESSEAVLDYRNAKNCLILSQTFYYEEQGKKIYILEFIKKNEWLNSVDFWRELILKMVKEEIKKFSELHYKDENYIKLNEKIDQLPEKIVKRIQDILFSQLITYITNMNEFNIAKKYIVQIVDEFTEKYNYLSKDQIQGILLTISPDEKEIEKFRKEYKADNCALFHSKSSENLSTKLANENDNDNDKINQDKRRSANIFQIKGLKPLGQDNSNNTSENNTDNSKSSIGIKTIYKKNIHNIKEDVINESDKKNINVDKNNDDINSKSNTVNKEENKK